MCTEGDILVATWDMEMERTISHSWSSDSEQPEPFLKLLFEGCIKEIKVAFPGHRYDVFLERFTPIPPKPALPFTEIFRNTLASLFQSSQGNVRRHSDKKGRPSQDGDGDEASSTADYPNPKDPEDRDRAHSDENLEAQNSSHQDTGEDGGTKPCDDSHAEQNSSGDSEEDSGIKLCDDSHAEQISTQDSREVSGTAPFDEANQSKASGMGRCSPDQDNTNEEQSSSKEGEPKPSSWGIRSIFSNGGKTVTKVVAGIAGVAFAVGIGYRIYKRG